MTFRPAANIDTNQHKGLVLSNSINNQPLIATGLSLTNSQPLHVAIVDGSGSQITSFGGGTQYATGTSVATPTGTAALGWDGTAVRVLSTDSSGKLNVLSSASTPTTVRYGQSTVSVTNTAVQLTSQAVVGVIIQALAANGGNVVVGDSSVTTANGFQLQPGQAVGIAIDNVNRVYVNGTSGDGVCWFGS